MRLHPAQSTIASDLHRFRVLCCGRRFGKTVLAVEEMVGVAIAKKDRRVAYFAPTRDDAREITWSMLVKKCENIITYKNESLLQLKIMTQDEGESQIALYGWESVQERGKGRGLANDFIVCDEVATYRNFWIGWNEVLAPTLIDNKGSAMFISTPHGFNHFYDLYNTELKDKDFKSFHFTSYDNPHIPVDELEREKKTKPSDTFAQEYLADFKKSTGLVYKEFNRSRHVFQKEEGKAFVKTFGGLDFGFTNPCAAITIKKDRFAVYWVTDEWYKTQQTDAQIADYVQALKWDECYPDPESPAAIEELRKRGVNTREVVKNKDSIKNGINVVRELFKTNRLRIHESCVNVILEFESYSYPESRPEKNEDENPIKEGDHAMDALRYALTMDNALTVEQYHPPMFYENEIITNPAE